MGSDPMVKKSFRDTLRARGVCSRTPHLGVSSTPTHGQISTHVYVPYIIPFLRHPRHNHVNLASIQPPSQSPSFHQSRHTIHFSLFSAANIHRLMNSPHTKSSCNRLHYLIHTCNQFIYVFLLRVAALVMITKISKIAKTLDKPPCRYIKNPLIL